MISQDDIEAFREDAEVFDRVNKRVLKGVPQHREMRAEEVIAYVRHAMRVQGWLSLLLDERDQRNSDAMSPGEPEAKYTG